jgi:hypothetical protein
MKEWLHAQKFIEYEITLVMSRGSHITPCNFETNTYMMADYRDATYEIHIIKPVCHFIVTKLEIICL